MKKAVQSENAPKPIGPYSQAIKVGNFLFLSGQIAIDPKEGKITFPTMEAQTKQVMENITAILQAAEYTLENVVQANVFLSSMALFDEFNKVYSAYFKTDFPARTATEAQLPQKALVEISIVAYKDDPPSK